MKKVCIVSLGYMWFPIESGPSRFFQIAQTFVKNGFEVEVVTTDFQHFKKEPRDTKAILEQNYPFKITFIETMPYKKNIDLRRIRSNKDAAKKVEKHIKDHIHEYDAVYCAIPANNISARVSEVCKANQVPFIVDIEDLWPEAMSMVIKNNAIRKLLLGSFQRDAETTYRNADAAIGTSEDYTARAVQYNHRTDLPMTTVYVGCNLADFDSGVKEFYDEIDKPEGQYWISYAGSISTSYDIINLIYAMEIMISEENENCDIHLQILGTGSEKDYLEEYVKKHNLANVHFWGFTDYHKMAAVLAKSDLVVNSFVKGAPQSIVNKVGDYLASGKPMLNTLENPVFCDLVDKYKIGVNIEAGNALKFKNAVLEYYQNPERSKMEGENARKLAETEFDRDTSYQKIVEVTRAAIEEK